MLKLTVIIEEISRILKTDNLDNDDKTEKTLLEREKYKNKENWRMVKKLGSLLGDTEDVIRRKQLASAAMAKMDKLWIRGKKIHIKIKTQIVQYVGETHINLQFMHLGIN